MSNQSRKAVIDAQVEMTYAAYGKQVTGAAKAAWQEGLEHIGTEWLLQAFKVCRQNSRYLFSIADVIEESVSLQNAAINSAKPRPVKNRAELSPEEQAEIEAMLRDVRATLGW